MAKSGKRGGKRRGGKGYKGARDVPEWASLSCKRTILVSSGPPPVQFNVNTLYSLMNTQLTDYPRAVAVASAYQHYRIKKVTLTIKPTFDTFLSPAGGSKIHLYHMIDKSGAIPTNIALEGLKAMGAKPKELDENSRIISWRPSVLESVMYAGGGVGAASSSKYKISPWLTTSADNVSPGIFQPSGVDHLGVYWYVEQLVGPGTQYQAEVEVQFEFKKPLTNINLAATPALGAIVAPLNDSPDGVVGGGDGY